MGTVAGLRPKASQRRHWVARLAELSVDRAGGSWDHQIGCKFGETMLDIANDIRSLSDFKRHTSKLLGILDDDLGLPVDRQDEWIAGFLETLLLERMETIEGIQRGLADVRAGRTKPAREVFNRLRRKHAIPR